MTGNDPIWAVTSVCVKPGSDDDYAMLGEMLAEGWEPFAVTWDGTAWDYHLRVRRPADPA